MPLSIVTHPDGRQEIVIETIQDFSRRFGGEGLHGWMPEEKPRAKTEEPFDPHFGGKMADGWR